MVSQMTGMATTTIHAPLANLLISTMTRTTPVKQAPIVLIVRDRIMRRRAALAVGWWPQQPVPVPDHPGLAAHERDEHADDVQLDQPGG